MTLHARFASTTRLKVASSTARSHPTNERMTSSLLLVPSRCRSKELWLNLRRRSRSILQKILLERMSHGLADFLALQESALPLSPVTPPLFRPRRTIMRRVSSRRHDAMSHIHVLCTLHTMSHNIPLTPPHHASHINCRANSSYDLGQMPFN